MCCQLKLKMYLYQCYFFISFFCLSGIKFKGKIKFFSPFFQASGVTVTDACKQVFEKIKTKKDYRYVVFYIKDEKFIDVESTGKESNDILVISIVNSIRFFYY